MLCLYHRDLDHLFISLSEELFLFWIMYCIPFKNVGSHYLFRQRYTIKTKISSRDFLNAVIYDKIYILVEERQRTLLLNSQVGFQRRGLYSRGWLQAPAILARVNYRVFRKTCVFFIFHCNPSLAYIAVSELQRSLSNASVQSLLLAGNILYNQ